MDAYEGDEDYIFVSYAHKDSATVLPVIAKLQSEGFRVWFDEGIETGSEWTEYIADHLDRSRCFAAFLSEAASVSPHCRREIHRAVKLQKDMLVVYLEDVQLSPGMEMQLDVLQALKRRSFADDTAFYEAIRSTKLLQPCREATVGAPIVTATATTTAAATDAAPRAPRTRPLPFAFRFARGYLSPEFAMGTNGILDLVCPRILMTDGIVSGGQDVRCIINAAKKESSPLLVIARDVDEDALKDLIRNGARKGLQICVVRAPGYGDRRKALLGDIAAVTGGSFLEQDQDLGLLRVTGRMLGGAELARVTEESTCIYGGFGSERVVGQRIAQIEREIEGSYSDFDREKLSERRAMLMGQGA